LKKNLIFTIAEEGRGRQELGIMVQGKEKYSRVSSTFLSKTLHAEGIPPLHLQITPPKLLRPP